MSTPLAETWTITGTASYYHVAQTTQRTVGGDPDWFTDPAWQAGEDEADQQIKAGQTQRFESDDEFLASL